MAKATKNGSTDKIPEFLIEVLSNTYVLMVKVHGYHWNVKGPLFPQLHEFFGKQYEDLLEAADAVAERIRQLNVTAPGSMAAFLGNTTIKETANAPDTATAMLRDLLKAHEATLESVKAAGEAADDVDDVATEDLMIARMHYHHKMIWMIRSQLD